MIDQLKKGRNRTCQCLLYEINKIKLNSGFNSCWVNMKLSDNCISEKQIKTEHNIKPTIKIMTK